MNLHNGQITVNELLSNPRARALLARELPSVMNNPLLRMAGEMTLSRVLGVAQGRVPRATVEHVLEQLPAL